MIKYSYFTNEKKRLKKSLLHSLKDRQRLVRERQEAENSVVYDEIKNSIDFYLFSIPVFCKTVKGNTILFNDIIEYFNNKADIKYNTVLRYWYVVIYQLLSNTLSDLNKGVIR